MYSEPVTDTSSSVLVCRLRNWYNLCIGPPFLSATWAILAGALHSGTTYGSSHCFRYPTSVDGRRSTLQGTAGHGYGYGHYRICAWRNWLSINVPANAPTCRLPKCSAAGSVENQVSSINPFFERVANAGSICYTIALCISTSKPNSAKGNRRNCGWLIDFRGFLDLRYTILCIGAWFSILGIWIPSYYIS